MLGDVGLRFPGRGLSIDIRYRPLVLDSSSAQAGWKIVDDTGDAVSYDGKKGVAEGGERTTTHTPERCTTVHPSSTRGYTDVNAEFVVVITRSHTHSALSFSALARAISLRDSGMHAHLLRPRSLKLKQIVVQGERVVECLIAKARVCKGDESK